MKKFLSIALSIQISIFLVFICVSLSDKGLFKTLEVQKLVVRSPSGNGAIQLGFVGEQPVISMTDAKQKLCFQIVCEKDNGTFVEIYDKMGTKRVQIQGEDSSMIFLNGKKHARMRLECKDNPAVFLKNEEGKTIGSWTILQDGGAGLGLANGAGMAASIIRGGKYPGVGFFARAKEPVASLGVTEDVSHLYISGKVGNEGVMIHGGKTSGLMVLDEMGTLKLFLSKKGIFQGKEEAQSPEEENPKFFTDERDHDSLFPDQKERTTIR